MPRASDGTVTLPVGNPVVSGTAISADVHNNTMTDIASMIEDSLSRDGQGGMRAAMEFTAGDVTSPGITFAGDTNTGIYDETADNPAITAGGTKAQEWTSTGTSIPGTLAVTGAATVGGTLGVTGTTSLGNVSVGNDINVVGDLQVTGNITGGSALSGALTVASLPATNGASSVAGFTTDDESGIAWVIPTDPGARTLQTGSITTNGKPVLVMLTFGSGSNAFQMYATVGDGEFKLVRTSSGVDTDIGYWNCPVGTINTPIYYWDLPATGTYTYKIMYRNNSGGTTFIQYARLFAYEQF